MPAPLASKSLVASVSIVGALSRNGQVMDEDELREAELWRIAIRESMLRSGRRRYRGRSNKKAKEETKDDNGEKDT
jgi:hypothetical protein